MSKEGGLCEWIWIAWMKETWSLLTRKVVPIILKQHLKRLTVGAEEGD